MERGLPDGVPPHNDQAEAATLGAILIDAEAFYSIEHLIHVEDFYKGAHQKIYEAISSMYRGGQSVDLVTLAEELSARGTLEQCGGAARAPAAESAAPQ